MRGPRQIMAVEGSAPSSAMLHTAKFGAAAYGCMLSPSDSRRIPAIPSIRATLGPCRSISSSPTFFPAAARAAARFTATVLFPTPPLPLITSTLLRTSRILQAIVSSCFFISVSIGFI